MVIGCESENRKNDRISKLFAIGTIADNGILALQDYIETGKVSDKNRIRLIKVLRRIFLN